MFIFFTFALKYNKKNAFLTCILDILITAAFIFLSSFSSIRSEEKYFKLCSQDCKILKSAIYKQLKA